MTTSKTTFSSPHCIFRRLFVAAGLPAMLGIVSLAHGQQMLLSHRVTGGAGDDLHGVALDVGGQSWQAGDAVKELPPKFDSSFGNLPLENGNSVVF